MVFDCPEAIGHSTKISLFVRCLDVRTYENAEPIMAWQQMSRD